MNKYQLYEFFNCKISNLSIQKRDDEWIIRGKWSIVSVWDDGLIDIWLCNAPNLPQGMLGERTLTNMLRGVEKSTVGTGSHRLSGEAYTQTRDKDVVLLNLGLLGIRKKRRVTTLNGLFSKADCPLHALGGV